MNVYPVPDSFAGNYGVGYALAAIAGGQVLSLKYIAEHVDEKTQDELAEGGAPARNAAFKWIGSQPAGPVVRELQALGRVCAGMCSGWEFVEL